MPNEDLKRELLSENYPSNSLMRKPERDPEKKKVEKVITGDAKQQKKGIGRRITETFLEDNTRSVGDYILHDVLIPAAKAMISDMISGGIEMLLFGQRRGSRTYRDGGRSYTNYNSISYRGQPRDVRPRELSRVARARHEFDEIVIPTRGEAEEVLSALADLVVDYGQASVADLYDLCGIDSNFTDNKYGWTDLRGASVSRVRNGYVINLPRTQPID